MEPEEKKSNGAFIGLVIIIIILIVGGIYIWQSKVKSALKENTQTESVKTTADSGELDTLEQDLETTDTNIDVDVNSIE